jgi:hypothetical protein
MKPNIKSYATAHNLPYYQLCRAYLNLPTRSNRELTNRLLTKEQDLALVRYLDAINAIGYDIHRNLVAT